MSRSIRWSTEAARDFDEAMAYIAYDSGSAANKVAERILSTIDRLGDLPAGRPGRVAWTYEKLVLKTPYIIAYAMTDHSIEILRIIHGARDWPEGEWPAE